jgi:ABC-2 type transport system permease protein
MGKLGLIIRREYMTRVRKKSFILTTLITPLAFLIFFVVIGFIFAYQSDDVERIAIIDEGDILGSAIKDHRNLYFEFSGLTLEELKPDVESGKYDGVLLIPSIEELSRTQHQVFYYSDDQLELEKSEQIKSALRSAIRSYKIRELQLDEDVLNSLQTNVVLDPEPIYREDDHQKDASTITSIVAAILGGVMGIVMYLVVFIYGMMVMRSVMEEKANRIVEIIISSVRPFQLMLGKILGVGAVGLTQLMIWLVVIPLLYGVSNFIFGFQSRSAQISSATAGELQIDEAAFNVSQVAYELASMNWLLITPSFIIFFLGGYLLYASLFAAVGSAIGDDLGESQSLTLPITIPVLMAFYIMIVVIRAPNSSLAMFASMFPFFSPIVMPARLAFDPPIWQVLLSMAILIVAVILFVWLSGRIYRTAILMYGKKAKLKQLMKWMFVSR